MCFFIASAVLFLIYNSHKYQTISERMHFNILVLIHFRADKLSHFHNYKGCEDKAETNEILPGLKENETEDAVERCEENDRNEHG